MTSEDPFTVKVHEYIGTLEVLVIPSTVKNDSKIYGVTFIDDNAFENHSSLTSIIIPNSVTSIGSSAFTGCSGLTSITIGNGVISIGSSAFTGCSSLTSITIPDRVAYIGDNAFYDCSALTSINIPDGVTSIGSGVFYNCSALTSILIPSNVTLIGNQAFYGCSGLISIIIPNGVTFIGNQAFSDCLHLISIAIPNNVTFIGDNAFYGCSALTSVTIPNSVTHIGDQAFYNCKFYSSGVEITSLIASNLAGYTYSGSNCENLVRGVTPVTVSFMSGEETILLYEVGPGAIIVLPNYSITQDSTDKYDYIFGWEGYTEGMTVVENTIFNATFNEVLRYYTITWFVDEIEITTLVTYDTVPIFDGTPTKDPTAQYTYIFKWNVQPVAVTGPATYTAEFNEVFRIYTEVPSTEVLNNLIGESDTPVLQVTVNAIETIDNSVFQSLVDKPFIINVMIGNDIAYSWMFNGAYKAEAGTFNDSIETTLDENFDEDLNDVINSANIKNPLVLKFRASGELPINASVRYDVEDKYSNGTKISLFFYNEETKKLEDQSQIITVDDGFVTLELTHCSLYVLSEIPQEAAAANNNTLLYVGIVIVIVVILSLIAVVVLRSKNMI